MSFSDAGSIPAVSTVICPSGVLAYMTERSELGKAVDYFIQKGDLDHLAWIDDLAIPDDLDGFETVGRVLDVDPDIAADGWIIASALKSLYENELIDGGDGSETNSVDLEELLLDDLSLQTLDIQEEREMDSVTNV